MTLILPQRAPISVRDYDSGTEEVSLDLSLGHHSTKYVIHTGLDKGILTRQC